ncbi:MAG: lysine biosynthesis protein LysX [Ignisphaera sp.]
MKIIARIAIAYEVLRWEEKSLYDVAQDLGLEVELVHLHNVYIPMGYYLHTNSSYDVVLQRAISHTVALNSTLAFESIGFKVVNSSTAIAIATNKIWTLKILAQNKIPVPRTAVSFDLEPSLRIAQLLGYPVVVKPIDGSWGRLIAMARDDEELRSVLEHRTYIPNPSMKVNMIQEFIKKFDRDIRVFVVGNEVVAAMYRINRDHWITNMARGSVAIPAKIDKEIEELALKTAKVVNGEVLGIDVFEHQEQGYVVNEVNAIPEFKNLISATGIPVHLKIVEYAKSIAKR